MRAAVVVASLAAVALLVLLGGRDDGWAAAPARFATSPAPDARGEGADELDALPVAERTAPPNAGVAEPEPEPAPPEASVEGEVDRLVVVGRLVSGAGDPVAHAPSPAALSVVSEPATTGRLQAVFADSRVAHPGLVEVEDDGTFRAWRTGVLRWRGLGADDEPLTLVLREPPRRRALRRTSPPRRARAPLPWPLPAGEIDVGTIVLEEEPVLLAGRVVDHLGAPYPNVTLRVVDGAAAWGGSELDVVTDDRGRFEARRDHLGGELTVRFPRSPRTVLETVDVAPGSVTALVRVVAVGSVEGRLADAWRSDRDRLVVGARPVDVGTAIDVGPDPPATSIDSDGAFRLERLPVGRYDLVVLLSPSREEVARLRDVEVLRGFPSRDPRLWGLELPPGALPPRPLPSRDGDGR